MEGRDQGPWDVSEISDDVQRLDLGAIWVTPTDGVDVQVQADQATGVVSQLNFSRPDAMVQVQPYAAPGSGGLWDDVRGQIKSSINSAGGLVEEVQGPFGTELKAKVTPSDGSSGLQPARFCGIEGPRWFLRAVFLGRATQPGEAADALEAMVRSLIVVRGQEAMPVGSPIPLRLPQQATEDVPAGPGRPSPFERGPEITEIR